jgi:hypothetical protein
MLRKRLQSGATYEVISHDEQRHSSRRELLQALTLGGFALSCSEALRGEPDQQGNVT